MLRIRSIAYCVFIMALSALLTAGCASSAVTQPTATPASAPATSVPSTAIPLVTSQPTLAPTQPLPTTAATIAPPTAVPSPTNVATMAATLPPAATDLNDAEMLTIAQASFSAYPWRMKQTVTTKATNQTFTADIEATGPETVHTVSRQPIGTSVLVLETILITPTLYGKATGGPPGAIQSYGFTEGQWAKVPTTSPAYALVSAAVFAANPLRLLESIGYGTQPGAERRVYKLVGSENVGSVPTNIYEFVGPSATQGKTVTYRVWIGARDRKIYKMTSDGPETQATSLLEPAPGLTIVPPIP